MKEEDYEMIQTKLKNLKWFGPSIPYRDGLKIRLIEELIGRRVLPAQSYFSWRIAFIVSLIVIFLGGGSAVLAQNSLPGHPLYPVKRGVENVKLIFVNKDDKPEVEKKLVNSRIDELKKAVETEDKQVTTSAVREVEESMNKINLQVISARNRYKVLISQSMNSEEAKKELNDLLQMLVEKQSVLVEIENTLTEPEKDKIQIIRENLRTLQMDIEKDLNILESSSNKRPVQGAEIQENTEPADSALK